MRFTYWPSARAGSDPLFIDEAITGRYAHTSAYTVSADVHRALHLAHEQFTGGHLRTPHKHDKTIADRGLPSRVATRRRPLELPSRTSTNLLS